MEQQAPDLRRQLLPGGVEAELRLAGQLVQHLGAPAVVAHALPAAGLDGPLVDGEGRVGDDQLLRELALEAQAVAGGAGAVGRVEGEGARLQLRQPQPEFGALGVVAGQLGGEELLRAVKVHEGRALGEVAGDLQAVRQPRLDGGAHFEAVDDHLQGVLLLLVQVGDALGEVQHLAIHLGPDVAALHEVLEQLPVLALAAPHHGRQDLQLRPLGLRQDLVRHLLDGLAGDGLAAGHAGGLARAGEEQAKVVVDLRHRGHGGAGVLAGALLLDGDGGREALDAVHIGLLHLVEELPGVGREALDIASLALGIERVEGQAGLARARQPRDHHQLVARQRQVQVLEVVLPRALDVDVFHRSPSLRHFFAFADCV